MIRIQLISPTLGSLVIRRGDPVDINMLTSELKRSKTNDGVIRQVTIDLKFIKRGRSFLKRCFEQTGGPDAKVFCNIYLLKENSKETSLYASGQVNFANYELTEDTLVVDVEQTGFQRLVENSIAIPVDLETNQDIFGNDLPLNIPLDIALHAKAIKRTYQKVGYELILDGSLDNGDGTYNFVIGTGAGTIAPGEDELYIKEILDVFELSSGIISVAPTVDKLYFIRCQNAGSYTFKIPAAWSVNIDAGVPGVVSVGLTLKLLYGTPGSYTTVAIGPGAFGFDIVTEQTNFESTIDLNAGDEVYLVGEFVVSGASVGTGVSVNFARRVDFAAQIYNIHIEALTKAPDSTTRGFLMHESVKRVVQYYTGQEDCFESTLLGRTDLGYAADGQGSLVANTNGNNIRKRVKPISHSLQSLLEVTNALYGTGIGYKTVDGVQKLVLETKDKFYDKSLRALSLGKVYNVRRRLDITRLFNQIQFGYSGKIELDQINATDAFNTLRNYVLPLRNSKNKLDFSTSVAADGYQIEYQRGFINSTNDARLDDTNFIIQCIRDGVDFKAKKDEGYDAISGVIDPASGYNYDIAPARCVRNWLKYLATSLIYSSDKNAKFASGTVNYELETQKTGEDPIKENDPVSLFGVTPIWKPFVLEFEVQRLSVADFNTLVEKANGYIEFEDDFGGVFKGFIDESVTHNPTTLQATFSLLEMFE